MNKTNDLTEKYSILIADDNPNNLKVLSSMLEKIGYNIRVAKNGEQAINSIKALPPDLILLDIHMPIMDGYEVCKQVKSNHKLSDIPVIFLSALTESFNKVQGFQLGAVDYITKPFEIEEVEIRIKTHINLREKRLKLQLALKELRDKEEKLIETEKMAALGVLTSGLAHEINNPINFISNSVLALKERTDKLIDIVGMYGSMDGASISYKSITKDFPEIYENIMKGVDYITKIVRGLRIYSRIEKEELQISDINELIDTSLLILYHKYKERIIIDKRYDNIPKVYCHPAKLSQVFLNVLSNSIDSIDEKELNSNGNTDFKITISTKKDEDSNSIIVEFIDNGVGVKEEIRNKIFDPFFTTKEVNKGTGLGLSICAGIIKEHNGLISLDYSNNTETKFRIAIPIVEEVSK